MGRQNAPSGFQIEDKSMVVFGGEGKWGRIIVNAARGLRMKCVSVIERQATPDEVRCALGQHDAIFIAATDTAIPEILRSIRDGISGKILMDCATTKIGFAELLEEIGDGGETSVCSTHPMVNPETRLRGHNAYIMPVGNNTDPATRVAESLYDSLGMNIQYVDFELHDKLMVLLQQIPHMLGRVITGVVGEFLERMGMTIGELEDLTTANFDLAKLAFGRVAIQNTDASAGIIAGNLQTEFGRAVLGRVQELLEDISTMNRERLADHFDEDVRRIDPGGSWRNRMRLCTDATLGRIGNLRRLSFQVDAPNTPGTLVKILQIISGKHGINMNAIDSSELCDGEKPLVRFDIGIEDTDVSLPSLRDDLAAIGVTLKLPENGAAASLSNKP